MSSPSFRFLAPMVLAALILAAQEPQAPAPPKLNLVVIAGQGASNQATRRSAPETIVQVQDEKHQPLPWATVVFLLPAFGPGGTFVTGAKSALVVTDGIGRAVMPRVRMNPLAGRYEIKVHASRDLLAANASISQTSVASTALSTGAIVAMVAAVAAAGAGAAVVATRNKGGSSPASPPAPAVPSVSIAAASGVSIGPPL